MAARIPVKGQPNKMTLNAAQSLLYVAEDQSDTVDVIDTARNAVLESIAVIAPLLPASLAQSHYKGANPNSVTLSPDETELYVTDGTLNCVSVIALERQQCQRPGGWAYSYRLVPQLGEHQLVSGFPDLQQRATR